MTKLRIGEISFANLFPIFYSLRREADCSDYEFVSGVPSDLNAKIRRGDIDISPSSSIEYLRNRDRYVLIDNHSISSHGAVSSILLFSKQPIEELGDKTVLVTSQSETSVALLHIILEKFYGVESRLQASSEPLTTLMKTDGACLLIGDDALVQADRWPGLYRYDLGDIWHRFTGLPFTFALWIMRKECFEQKKSLVDRFESDLDRSKRYAGDNFESIAKESPLSETLPTGRLLSYWRGICYDFGEEHRRGFELFRQYSKELGEI